MADISSDEINKGGETIAMVRLRRSEKGLQVTVKTNTSLEEYFKGLGNGSVQNAAAIAKYWMPADVDKVLNIYHMDDMSREKMTALCVMKGYRIDKPAQPLTLNDGLFNLSFLRVQGISDGIGVEFHVRGVFSKQATEELRTQIVQGIKSFYEEFLKPIDFVANIQSWRIPV